MLAGMVETAPPLVGVTLDSEPAGGYSKFPWYALRRNYAGALCEAGALAAALPHEPEQAEALLDRVDGLVVTGGAFDVDPTLFGARTRHPAVATKDRRTAFELAAVRAALARDKPVLGICGGAQLLNVALGGTLIQHIPDEVPDCLEHEQPNPRDEPGHTVALAAGTRLRAMAGADTLAVNSAHHQAVADPAPGVRIAARAQDGVVEGIELPSARFCVGVQWHPEFLLSDGDRALFAAFAAACRR